MNFAFTYIGPEPPQALLDTLDAKTVESCVDTRGFTHAFMTTHKPKRATNIEDTIAAWNAEQLSEITKVHLHPFPGEDSVVTFSKAPGCTAVDHFIAKTIKEARMKSNAGGESTYRFWSSQDSFASQAQPTKKRSLERELEIDMIDPLSRNSKDNKSRRGNSEEPNATTTDVEDEEPNNTSCIPPTAPTSVGSSLPASAAANDDHNSPPLARILSYEVVDPNSPEVIRAKDEVIKSKTEALAKCDELIKSKDEALAKCIETIKHKDEALSKCEEVINSKDEALSKCEETIQSKDETLAKRDETIQSKNESILMYKDVIKSKDQVIAAQQVAIDALRTALNTHKV